MGGQLPSGSPVSGVCRPVANWGSRKQRRAALVWWEPVLRCVTKPEIQPLPLGYRLGDLGWSLSQVAFH